MDIFTTLVQTSKKLGISAFAYLRDRLSGALEMPSLAHNPSGLQRNLLLLAVERIQLNLLLAKPQSGIR